MSHVASNFIEMRYGQEVSISYLPLSHVAGQMLDIFIPIYSGGTVHFARPDALKVSPESLLQWEVFVTTDLHSARCPRG